MTDGQRKALFLDRDGVINIDYGYVSSRHNFDFIEGIFELVAKANDLGYLVIVITNQSGIGRGYYSLEDFLSLNEWMISNFTKRNAFIDHVYYCPVDPSRLHLYSQKEASRRKPSPGMIYEAIRDFDINPKDSILLGDKYTDIEAGHLAGIERLLLFSQSLDNELVLSTGKAVNSLREALEYL